MICLLIVVLLSAEITAVIPKKIWTYIPDIERSTVL